MKQQNMFLSKKKANEKRSEKLKGTMNSIKEHIDNFSDKEVSDIALFNANGFKDITDNINSVLNIKGNLSKMKADPVYANDSDIGNKVYEKLTNNKFFHYMEKLDVEMSNVKSNQTGQELFRNIQKINEVNFNFTKSSGVVDFQDLNNAVNNFKNIIKDGGNVATFDIESLGGVNAFGHQQLDFITEISATMHNVSAGGKYQTAEQINSLLGFSKDEYTQVEAYISSLRGKTAKELTNKDNVFLGRLSMMADANIKVAQDGFEIKITDTSGVADKTKSSVDEALKGLEVYRGFGKQQEAWVEANGGGLSYVDYKKKYINDVADLIYEGKGQKGTYKNHVLIGQNSANFDNKMMGRALGKTIDTKPGSHLDTYQYIKYAEEIVGQGAHFNGLKDKLGNPIKTTSKYGTGTQDQMKHVFESFLDAANMQSHNARIDENTLMKIMMETPFTEKMFKNFSSMNSELEGLKSTHKFEGRDGIFLMDNTAQVEWNNNKGGLSFAHNPVSNTFKTFDGFEIDENGVSSKAGFKQFGPKKNALYKHDAYKIDLNTEKWKEQFKGLGMSEKQMDQFYQEYSTLDTMYLLRSKEYRNKDLLEKKFGKDSIFDEGNTFFRVLTSEDQLATSMGVKVAHENEDATLDWINKAVNGLDLKVTSQEGKKVNVRSVTGREATDMLMDRSLNTTTVESGARAVRDMQYTRMEKIRQYNLNNNLKTSERIAQMVSQGKTLDLNINKELIDEMGWFDFKEDKMKLVSESLGKATVLDKYVEEMNPVFNAINEVFDDMKLAKSFETSTREDGINVIKAITGGDMKTINAKKDWLFKKAVNDIMETVSSDPSVINNSSSVITSAYDLNRIDFNTFDLFPELEGTTKRARVSNATSEITSIDLNKNDALLNNFFKNKFKSPDLNKKGAAGFNALYEAYDRIGKDERFKGVWGDLSLEKLNGYQRNDENLSSLNDDMMRRLKEFVGNQRGIENNSGFGLIFSREAQDPTKVMNALKGMPKSQIKGLAEKSIKDVDLTVLMSKDILSNAENGNSELIDSIVDKYFMTFSKDDMLKNMDGYTEKQKNVLMSQYELAKKESRARALELVDTIKDTDMDLSVIGTGKEAKMFLGQGNQIRTLNMHQYVQDKGVITHAINGQEYATQLTYNTNKYVKNGKKIANNFSIGDHVTITNNVENAIERTRKLQYIGRDARKSGREVIDDISSAINSRSNMLREISPRKEVNNFANTLERAFHVDTNSFISILPELDDLGVIDGIAQTNKIPEKYTKMFKETIGAMRDKKIRPQELSKLLSNDKSTYFQLFQIGLPEYLNDGIKFNNIDPKLKDVFSRINNYTKNTAAVQGYMSLNDSPFAHGLAGYEKGTRPPQFQFGNPILQNKDNLRKEIEKEVGKKSAATSKIFKNLDVNSIVSNKASEKFMFNAGANGNLSAGITMKYLQVDSDSLRGVFSGDAKKARQGARSKFSDFLEGRNYKGKESIEGAKVLAEKAMSFSTYEQQSLMNSRVAYLGFNETNKQSIDAKKELLLTHKHNLDTIENVKGNLKKLYPTIDGNGNIVYTSGYEVNRGQSLGLFGKESTESINSKWDGVFRSRYFKDGEIVSEATLNNTVKGMTDHKDIINKLNNTFDLKYEVIQKYDTYGKKIFTEATEKTTMDSMDIRIGQIDKNLPEDLKKALAGSNIDASTLEDNVLGKSYIEEFLRPVIGDNLTERMLSERFLMGDVLSEQYDKVFGGVGQILNVDVFKHQSIAMGLTDILNQVKDDADKDDYFNAMLGKGNWEYNKEGTSILTDSLDKIKVRGFSEADFDGDAIKASRFNSVLNNVDWALDDNGKVVGHRGMAHVTQMRDDGAGTFSGNIDAAKTSKELRDVERQLRNTDLSPEKVLELEQRSKGLRAALDATSDYKGVKYSKNMNNLLQRAVYDQDSIGLANTNFNKMGIGEEFTKYFGHAANANGIVNEDSLGKSILDPITATMRGYLKKGHGETLLSDVDSMDSATRQKYAHLTDSFKKIKGDISLERAEQTYSINQGIMAIDFNKNHSSIRLKELTEKGAEHSRFNMVDLTAGETLSLDIGGQGKTITSAANNPYTNNLMLKYGDNNFLAIARMPETHFGDSMIKKEHIGKLSSLQKLMTDINSNNFTQEEVSAKRNRLAEVVEEIKNLQKKDVTSKTGLMGDAFETRMSQSFFGKASGITVNSLGADLENMKKADRGQYYNNLVDANSGLFTKSQFNGKNLLEHFSEGKVLDNVFLSKDSFDKMGYFDTEYMSNIFKKMDVTQSDMKGFSAINKIANQTAYSNSDVSAMKNSMMDLLESHGDNFISVRYPELQEGSDKVLMGYLNRDLKGNQIQVTGHTGLSMNLDHDGDTAAVVRAANKNRESYLDYSVNRTSADKQLLDNVNATNSIMMKRATSDNHYWNSKVQEKIGKEADVAKLAKMKLDDGTEITKLEAFARERIIDNDIFSSIKPTADMTTTDMAKYLNDNKHLVTQSIEEGNHDSVIAGLKSQYNYVDGAENAAYKTAKQEYSTAYAFQLYKDEMVAKSSNQAIGEINVTNKKISGIMQSLIDRTDSDYDYKTRLMTDFGHLSEEAVISAKSSTKGLDPDRAKVWNSNSVDLITGSGNELEIKSNMNKWIEEYVSKDVDLNKYYQTNESFKQKAHKAFERDSFTAEEFKSFIGQKENLGAVNKLKADMGNDYVEMLGSLRNQDNVTAMLQQLSLGQSQSGVSTGLKDFVSTDYETNMDTLRSMLRDMSSDNQDLNFIDITEKMKNSEFSSGNAMDEIISSAERNTSKKSMSHAILEGAGDFFKGVGSSGIAMGALGIAAGIMAVGFVGGRPRPADAHAMEEAEDFQAPMNGHSVLSDPGLAFGQGSGPNGYVVNINARTDKGRSHAVSAIQEAISNGTSSNINVSMNINDNYGNINDRDLEKAFADVLR